MEYKIVYVRECNLRDATKALEKEINNYIENGWKPLGGISIDKGDTYSFFTVVQAMVKE